MSSVRKDFFCRNQEEGENIDQYVASLILIDNKLRCTYEDDIQTFCTQCGHAGDCRLKERRISDWLIFGLRDPGMRRRVLLEDIGQNLTLDCVLQTCKAYKLSTGTGLVLVQESPAHLLTARRSAYTKATSEPPAPSPCANCGEGCHPRTQCTERKHFCGHCGKTGHFATVCRQKTRSLQQATLGHLYLHQTGAIRDHLVSIAVEINNDLQRNIPWLHDSSADVDALSVQDFRLLDPNLHRNLVPDHQTVCAPNGAELGSLGTLPATLKLKNRTCHFELHVYRHLSASLFSKCTCIEPSLREKGWPQMGVAIAAALSVEQPPLQEPVAPPVSAGRDLAAVKEAIVAELPSVFQDTPFCRTAGPLMHINLRSDAVPCQHYRAHTVPFQWRGAVEAQLSAMVSKGVIENVPVGESLPWCRGGGAQEAVSRAPDLRRPDRAEQVRWASRIPHPWTWRGRRQCSPRHEIFHHAGLVSRMLADCPWRSQF